MNSPVSPQTLLAQLHWRYATKKFDTTRKIPADLWSPLEEALVLTPSSYGLQPWKFVVVTDAALRQQLKGASWNQAQITDASHLVVFTAKKTTTPADVNHLIQTTAQMRGIPPAALDQYKNMMLGSIRAQSADQLGNWNSRQAYIALGVLLTSAALLGLDACPMEGISVPDYNQILRLDAEGLTALCVATVGYRAADDKYAEGAKVRYPAHEVLAHR